MTAPSKPAKGFPRVNSEGIAKAILEGEHNASTNQRGASEGTVINEAISAYAGNRAAAHAKIDNGVEHDLSRPAKRTPGQFDGDALKTAEQLLSRNGGKPLTASPVFRKI